MRFLFVYATEAEAEMLGCVTDIKTLPKGFKTKDVLDLVAYFNGTEGARILVHYKVIYTGYNLPEDTKIITTKGFTDMFPPDSAEYLQLHGRVGRIRPEKKMIKVSP